MVCDVGDSVCDVPIAFPWLPLGIILENVEMRLPWLLLCSRSITNWRRIAVFNRSCYGKRFLGFQRVHNIIKCMSSFGKTLWYLLFEIRWLDEYVLYVIWLDVWAAIIFKIGCCYMYFKTCFLLPEQIFFCNFCKFKYS